VLGGMGRQGELWKVRGEMEMINLLYSKQYQQMPYNLEDIEPVQKFVDEMMSIGLSENQIYEYSLKCEARTAAPGKT
jgi:hypothetical protein